MKRSTALVLALFSAAVSMTSASCRSAAPPVAVSNRPSSINGVPLSDAPLPPAKPIAEMGWTKFDGFEQKLADLRGKAVILDFWATNCPPCIEEIPHLKEIQARHGKENLELIGLHSGDEEDRRLVPEFVKKLKIDYTLGIPETELSRFVFSADDRIPQTLVFDRQGNLVRRFVGFDPSVKSELDAAVETAVNSQSK